MRNLAQYLLGSTRTAVLSNLLLHPEESLHVRELARLTATSPGTLHRELRALSELGLLTRTQVGRQVNYRANRDCPVFEELAGLLRKTAGLVDVLRAALQPLVADVPAAFVYGSVAAGTETPRSDVDVMVLGQVGFAEVVQALENTHAILRREVNPSVMKPAEFARKVTEGDNFALAILNGPKLWILGTRHDLAEFAENRSPERAQDHSG